MCVKNLKLLSQDIRFVTCCWSDSCNQLGYSEATTTMTLVSETKKNKSKNFMTLVKKVH